MASGASARKLTYDDFTSFPEDGLRHELIDGEHHVSPSPSLLHQRVSRRLLVALATYLSEHSIGEVFAAPADVVLSRYDVVVPDLLVVLNDQSKILTPANVQGAPAIVVEIESPGSRRMDEDVKRRIYEARGVREYWLVQPDSRRVTRYRYDGVAFAAENLGPDEALTSPLLPGFAMPVDELLPIARRPH